MSRRAVAYIDGFNFFHGVAKGDPPVKWLNLEQLCDRLLRGCDIQRVNYYTARVQDSPEDPGQAQRQDSYLRALESCCPRTSIVYGQFQKKKSGVVVGTNTSVELSDGTRSTLASGQRVWGRVFEEKGSDVNLGTDLSWDAATRAIDVALVISNDLDLQRPIDRAMGAGVHVVVVNPHHRTHRRPSLRGSDTRKLRRGLLLRHQLPDVVTLADGLTEVCRPADWS
jgi:hypothetical protein